MNSADKHASQQGFGKRDTRRVLQSGMPRKRKNKKMQGKVGITYNAGKCSEVQSTGVQSGVQSTGVQSMEKHTGMLAPDAWQSVFVHCTSQTLCILAVVCTTFRDIVNDAALSRLTCSPLFSKGLCDYLDNFGGKTCNDALSPSNNMRRSSGNNMYKERRSSGGSLDILDISIKDHTVKFHKDTLVHLEMLSISLFHAIVENEVIVHGVRLLQDYYSKEVLSPYTVGFPNHIKQLYYYESTMSKLMDIVMLQGILANVFQMKTVDLHKFTSFPMRKKALSMNKIDGTDMTQVLNAMTELLAGQFSLSDSKCCEEGFPLIPMTSATHELLQKMLKTESSLAINEFMANVLESIQKPFTDYQKLHDSKRGFHLGTKLCTTAFTFQTHLPPADYVCVMDITEGHVVCQHRRMQIGIFYREDGEQDTFESLVSK